MDCSSLKHFRCTFCPSLTSINALSAFIVPFACLQIAAITVIQWAIHFCLLESPLWQSFKRSQGKFCRIGEFPVRVLEHMVHKLEHIFNVACIILSLRLGSASSLILSTIAGLVWGAINSACLLQLVCAPVDSYVLRCLARCLAEARAVHSGRVILVTLTRPNSFILLTQTILDRGKIGERRDRHYLSQLYSSQGHFLADAHRKQWRVARTKWWSEHELMTFHLPHWLHCLNIARKVTTRASWPESRQRSLLQMGLGPVHHT